MFVKYLIVSSLEKSYIVDLFKKHHMEFDFLKVSSFSSSLDYSNKILIFEDIESELIYKFRQINYLARFICLNSNSFSFSNEKLVLCQVSAILEFPFKEELFFETIIKCDNEILNIQKELFSKNKLIINQKSNDVKYNKNESILLNMFLNNENILLSEDYILEYFHFFNIEISLKTLKNILSSIRKKDKSLNIENIYGVGYKYKKNILINETIELIDKEYEKNINISKNFDFNIDISCSYLLNKLDIDRVCFMEYDGDFAKILDEKVIYPQKKVLEQISLLKITDFHKKTISFSLKEEEPYIINFDEIVNLYFIFPKEFKGKVKAKSIVYFPFDYKNKTYAIGLHQNNTYRRWENSEIELLKKVIFSLKKISSD